MIIQRKARILMALLVMSVFIFQSCMTIMRGTYKKIPVTSIPSGAKIIVDGKEMGYAPLNLKLKRKSSHIIRIERQGYHTQEIQVARKCSLLMTLLGNYFLGATVGALVTNLFISETEGDTPFLIGGLLGFGVHIITDFSTGATYDLLPKALVITLLQKEEKAKSNIILIDAEQFQKIKWIRIKCDNSEKEDVVILN